jgi:hypothetical protein
MRPVESESFFNANFKAVAINQDTLRNRAPLETSDHKFRSAVASPQKLRPALRNGGAVPTHQLELPAPSARNGRGEGLPVSAMDAARGAWPFSIRPEREISPTAGSSRAFNYRLNGCSSDQRRGRPRQTTVSLIAFSLHYLARGFIANGTVE